MSAKLNFLNGLRKTETHLACCHMASQRPLPLNLFDECPATDCATDSARHLWMPHEFRTPTITHLRFGTPFAYLSHLLGLREGRSTIKTALGVKTDRVVITAIDIGIGRMGTRGDALARRGPRCSCLPRLQGLSSRSLLWFDPLLHAAKTAGVGAPDRRRICIANAGPAPPMKT